MSNNTITIGLDLGYGLTKAVASTDRQVCFESRVALAEFIRFQADIGAQTSGDRREQQGRNRTGSREKDGR